MKAMKTEHRPSMPRAASHPAEMNEISWSDISGSSTSMPRAQSSNDLSRRGDREEELAIMVAMMLSKPASEQDGERDKKRRSSNSAEKQPSLDLLEDVPETPSFFDAIGHHAGAAR